MITSVQDRTKRKNRQCSIVYGGRVNIHYEYQSTFSFYFLRLELPKIKLDISIDYPFILGRIEFLNVSFGNTNVNIIMAIIRIKYVKLLSF